MSYNNHQDALPFDPNPAYHAGAYPGFALPGAPAILVENVAEILEPIRQELRHMTEAIEGGLETSRGVAETMKELRDRIESLEAAVQKLRVDPYAGSDADDEDEGRRSSKRGSKKQVEGNAPPPEQRERMVPIVRKAVYSGCEVSDMKELKEGLPDEELKQRIAEDPALPWRPDWEKSYKHPDNTFWVNNIVSTSLLPFAKWCSPGA
ncbi:hypothetical protein FRC11_006171 [Ceratobasidium sp. 423]|nr:hypothetical protein FRC11_006171 [Ceratobasidium sp. 423]